MMKGSKLFVGLLALGVMNAAWACEVTQHAIGGVRLGMTTKQVKQTFPKAKIKRISDGEGIALISILLQPKVEIWAHADEEDVDKPINFNKKIKWLSSSSPACKTATGVHTGMKLAEVEKRYGKFMRIQRSEIEAREFAYFQKQPKWLEIQVESGSGVFPENADLAATTRRYTKNAVVEQLSIASH